MIDVGQLKKYDYVEIGGKIGQVASIDYYREVDDEHEEITVTWGNMSTTDFIVPNKEIKKIEPLTLKVGDRVRCINDWIFVSGVKVGTEGTITKIKTNGEVEIDFDGCDCWQTTSRPTLFLKKVNLGEEKMEFKKVNKLGVEKVIFNAPATILFRNGKKYITKSYQEEFDQEKGLALALLKSFGISYLDLKRMLKDAHNQKQKIEKEAEVVEQPKDNVVETKTTKRGRPRKIKVGDKVRVLSSTSDGNAHIKKMIGTICEVYSIPKGNVDYYGVWQADKKEWWAFSEYELELVKE